MSIGNSNIHQVSEIPEITKLPNGRLRVVRRFNKFTREDVDNANLGSLMGNFGDLDTAGQQIVNQGYTDLKLISVEVDTRFNSLSNNSNAVLVKTYETLTNAFVQVTDEDQIEELENGTKRLTRVLRAQSGTTYSGDVGTTDAGGSNTSFILAKSDLKDSGAFAELTLTFLKQGTVLSVSEDKVGSQKAVVNEVFNPASESITGVDTDNATLSGYSEADRTESNYDGIKTIRIRFLKNDVQLSQSVDNESPLKTEVQEWFNPGSSRDTKSDYSLINKQESNVGGIPTERYTFAKDNVTVSVSEEKIGSQNAVVNEIFNPSSESITGVDTDNTALSGYSEADRTESNYDGIKTIRVRFLKNNVTLQTTEDKVGSQLAIVKEVFNGTPSTPSGYSVADESISNVDGVPTRRFRFLKDNVTLSTSEDKIGSQLAIVKEVFNGTPSTPTGYSIADEQVSSVDGIPTRRFRFLKNDVVLSRSKDSVGSQKAVVLEVFNGDNEASDANSYGAGSSYVLAREEESNVDGVKTRRYTYLEPSILSVQEDKNTPENRTTVRVFNLASNDTSIIQANDSVIVNSYVHILVSQSDEDYEGIKTSVYVFESKDYNTQTTNEFGRTIVDRVQQDSSAFTLDNQSNSYTVDGVSGLKILNQRIENNDNDINKKTTRYTTVGIDEIREDIIGSQKAIIITKIGGEPTTSEASQYSDITYDGSSDWSIARKDNSRVDGLDVYTYTFLLDNTVLSVSEDKVGSQEAYIEEIFNPLVTIPGVTISGGSNVAGDYFLGTSQNNGKDKYFTVDGGTYPKLLQYTGSVWEVRQVSTQYATSSVINPNDEDAPPETGWTATSSNASYEIENLLFREFDNTLPTSLQFLSTSHRYEKDGYVLAKMDRSNIDGIPTVRYTFLRPSILSVANEFSTSRNIVRVQAFNKSSAEVTSALSEVTSNHKLISQEETNHDGIATTTYTYVLDEYDAVSYTTTGLLNVTRTSYEVANYDYTSAGNNQLLVGTDTITVNSKTLYLQNFDVENGTTCTRLVKTYVEYGVLNKTERLINEGVKSTTYQYLGSSVPTEVSTLLSNGVKISESVNRKLGIPLTTVVIYTDKDGNSLTNSNGAEKLNYQYHQISPFILPGVVDLVNEHNHVFPKIQSPVETKVNAQVQIFYQTSAELDESSTGDFYKKKVNSSLVADTTTNQGFWSPREFAQKESHVDAFIDDNGNLKPAYYNSQGIRGVRTRESSKVNGVEVKTFPYNYRGGVLVLEDIAIDETTDTLNGKPVHLRSFPFTYDIVHTVNVWSGIVIRNKPTEIRGTTTFRIAYNVDSNYANKWVMQTKTTYKGYVGVYDYYGSVRRAFQAGNTGEWQRARPFRPASETNWTTQAFSASNGNLPWDETWTSLIKEIDSSGDNDPFSANTYTELTTADDFSTTQAISNPIDQVKTITFTEPTREESFGFGENRATGGASTNQTISLTTNAGSAITIPQAGFFLEGRQVDNGATGRIEIKGGPPNPLGKRYTLDVQIQRAFDDIDGTAYYMKKVVVADINPIGIE
jgi:hypothetical protein|tara:strand:+ start:13269 stop:17876 length:4608 start_codon:yes stop_codon:yes gene_type:complete